jgi:hypothetical protein
MRPDLDDLLPETMYELIFTDGEGGQDPELAQTGVYLGKVRMPDGEIAGIFVGQPSLGSADEPEEFYLLTEAGYDNGERLTPGRLMMYPVDEEAS